MSGISFEWDVTEIEDWVNQLKEKTEEDISKLMEETIKEIAARTLAKVIARTPVDSGHLRRGWTGGEEVDPYVYAYNSLNVIIVDNSAYVITLHNPVDYAAHVEYGHDVVGGSKASGGTVVGHVDGVFMLRKSIAEMEEELPGILEEKFIEWLGD